MSDDDTSGNRWEAGATPAGTEPTSPAQPIAASEPTAAAEDGATPAPAGLRDRARRLRGNRAAQAGGVVAVLLAVGAAGFGAGWAASPDSGEPSRTGPDGHHGFPGDFAGDEDGDGHLPPGQQPDGTQPGTSQSSWYVVPSGSAATT